LRYLIKLLPILLFEVLWKLLWLSVVALPKAITGSLGCSHHREHVQLLPGPGHPGRHPLAVRVAHLRASPRRQVALT
jgi:hypothetical protein